VHSRSVRSRSRISAWTRTTVLVTIVVSVAAIVVSVLAYSDQHHTDSAALAAAALASEQQYARQVAFWVDVGQGVRLPVLMVENLGSSPIANAELTLRQIVDSTGPQENYAEKNFALGVIPPCTISSTPINIIEPNGNFGNAAADFHSIAGAPFFDTWLNFTDAAGKSWQRNGDGSLRELAHISPMPAVVSLHSTYKSTATCS
jgi:hypothetical protein